MRMDDNDGDQVVTGQSSMEELDYEASDYNVEEEAETRDAPPTNEKSPPKSQTYRGTNRNVAGFPPTVDLGDDIWMADEAKFQTLRDIETLERRLQDLKDYSDIAFEMSAQREYERVEKQLILLKETLPSA